MGGGHGVVQIMYTHVSKYKNDKIKFKKITRAKWTEEVWLKW
jgi:hypothetical protein